ncbi:MAG TPA: CvpA family protein [Gammaproteobacteria bacterium]|nr:CvpA family protein [Gammaproteobacteria bacterium]
MQIADILILVLFALPALVGVFYGFLNIAFSLLAWTLALGVSAKFTPYFSPMLSSWIETPLIRVVLAFVGLFIISLIILTGIGFLIVKLLGRTGLTATDRILGLFFGMGLGTAIITVVVFLAGFTALPAEDWWQESRLVGPFERLSIWGERFLPESMVEYHGYEPVIPESGMEAPEEVKPEAAPAEEQS